MKFSLKFLFLLFAFNIILTGCSSNENIQNNNLDIKNETITYNSLDGDVTFKKNPKIVADYYVGELLKLEANVVGANLKYKSSAWESMTSNITDIGDSIETVLSLKPDLIITMNKDMLTNYTSIAPTICIPYGTYNPEELLLELSKITNSKEIADNWINSFNKGIEDLSLLLTKDSKTYTIIDILGQDLYLYGENYGRAGYILYNKMGLKGTKDAETDYIRKTESYLLLTVESMPKYIGDNLLIMNENGLPSGNNDTFKKFTENLIFENLDAVKNNNISYFKSEDFWYVDPFSLDSQIDILKEYYNDKNKQ